MASDDQLRVREFIEQPFGPDGGESLTAAIGEFDDVQFHLLSQIAKCVQDAIGIFMVVAEEVARLMGQRGASFDPFDARRNRGRRRRHARGSNEEYLVAGSGSHAANVLQVITDAARRGGAGVSAYIN